MNKSKRKFQSGDTVELIRANRLPLVGKIIDINVKANGEAQYYVDTPVGGGVFLVSEWEIRPLTSEENINNQIISEWLNP